MIHDVYLNHLLYGFKAGVQAAQPEFSIGRYIPEKPKGKTIVIGAGKASAMMAKHFEEHWHGELTGLVLTRYGHKVKTRMIDIIEAAHPIPDQQGLEGSRRILDLLAQSGPDDLVIALISGGGSALLSLPVKGVTLTDAQLLTTSLLKSGASIHEINIVRKHLTQTLGGKLAEAAYPAKLVTLAISDVTGDDPTVIASGATVPDPSTLADARAVIAEYGIPISNEIRTALDHPENETPKADNPVFTGTSYHLIAAPQISLQAAYDSFCEHGFSAHILSNAFEGDTNSAAAFHAALVQQIIKHDQPFKKPCVLISGGETTVTVKGAGEGGPNTQFMLALAIKLNGQSGVYALACDTDGIDGVKDNAGAIITPGTLAQAKKQGLDPQTYLNNNDSYGFFKAVNGLVMTGPTHTNVNDLRLILIL